MGTETDSWKSRKSTRKSANSELQDRIAQADKYLTSENRQRH